MSVFLRLLTSRNVSKKNTEYCRATLEIIKLSEIIDEETILIFYKYSRIDVKNAIRRIKIVHFLT